MFGLVSKRKLDELQREYDNLKKRIEDCVRTEIKNQKLNDEIYQLRNELTEVKIQIRKQTEADLYFISAKIQKKLLDGEPKEQIRELQLQQFAYQQQLAQMQAPSVGNSLLAALGASNLFGRC